MNSKRQKCTMRIKAFRLLSAVVLLAGLMASTIGVAYASDGAGNALDFDGTDDYVEIPDNAALDANLGDSFTIEAWIRTSQDADNMIFAKHSGGDDGSYYFATRSGGVLQLTVLTSNGRQDHTVNFSYNDGKWHHVAGVYAGEDPEENLKIYVDGAQQVGENDSQTGNVDDTDHPVRIGFYDGSSDWFYNGLYDEIRLWDDARTQTEIQANMYKTLTGSESGLVGYWKFDESSGTTATDSKGSNDGTLNNMEDSDWVTSGAFAGPRNALDFDGDDDYVSAAVGVSSYSSFTVEAWVYHTGASFSGFHTIVEFGDDGPFLGLNDGYPIFYNTCQGPTALVNNRWYHLAWVQISNSSPYSYEVYLDGVLACSGTEQAYTTAGSDMGIGYKMGADQHWKGLIDEVRLWNDVRTATEIRDNMFRTLDGDESGLVAYYRFDQYNTSGQNTLYDITANGYNGTLTSMDATTDWVSSTAFNTWIGAESTSWATGGNWSDGGAPTSSDNVGIYSYTSGNNPTIGSSSNAKHVVVATEGTLSIASDATLTCGGDVIINGTLSIASGGTLDLDSNKIIASTGTFTNNGTCTNNETYELTLDATTVFSDSLDSPAAAITPATTNPGTTVVTTSIGSTIPANAFGSTCPAASSSVERYYTVTADTSIGLNVTLRLYYDDAELNGNTEGNLKIWHCEDGAWVDKGGTVDTDNNYVEVTVTSFSPFILGDSGPTAVTLARFTASPAGDASGFVLPLALVALGVVGGTLLRARRRRRCS